jgi:hypothetical protein
MLYNFFSWKLITLQKTTFYSTGMQQDKIFKKVDVLYCSVVDPNLRLIIYNNVFSADNNY